MTLINCEINLILTCPADSFVSDATEATKFAMADTN